MAGALAVAGFTALLIPFGLLYVSTLDIKLSCDGLTAILIAAVLWVTPLVVAAYLFTLAAGVAP